MHIEYLDCSYECGTPHTLLFHYKIEHKDKVRGVHVEIKQ